MRLRGKFCPCRNSITKVLSPSKPHLIQSIRLSKDCEWAPTAPARSVVLQSRMQIWSRTRSSRTARLIRNSREPIARKSAAGLAPLTQLWVANLFLGRPEDL